VPEFKYVSRDALDLMKRLMNYDPEQRISAEDAIKHPWIQKKAYEEIDPTITLKALQNLRNFTAEKKL
jgi:serine/threonine protein kinase